MVHVEARQEHQDAHQEVSTAEEHASGELGNGEVRDKGTDNSHVAYEAVFLLDLVLRYRSLASHHLENGRRINADYRLA